LGDTLEAAVRAAVLATERLREGTETADVMEVHAAVMEAIRLRDAPAARAAMHALLDRAAQDLGRTVGAG
jgi:DNA-binding FadR family transcriptional regulator